MDKTAKENIRKDLLRITLTAVCVRLLVFFFLSGSGFSQETARTLYPDSVTYSAPAKAILEEGRFLNAEGAPEIYRTPGYPLFLAFCSLIFGDGWAEAAVFLQNLSNLAAVLLVYGTLLELCGNRRAAFSGGMLACLNIHDVYFCFFILSDILFQFLILAAAFFLIRFFKRLHSLPLILAAGLFAAGMFVRPSGLYLPVFLTAVIGGALFLRPRSALSEKQDPGLNPGRLRRVMLPLLFLILSMGPALLWCRRNEAVSGFSGFSAIQSANLYGYHSAGVLAFVNGTDFYQEQEHLRQNSELSELQNRMSLQQAETALAKQIILTHLPVYLLLNLEGAGMILLYPGLFDVLRLNNVFMAYLAEVRTIFLSPGSFLSRATGILFQPFSLLVGVNFLLLLALLLWTVSGMIRSLRGGTPWYIGLTLCGIFLYFLLISAGPNGYGTYPRFRLSLSLFQAIFCGIGLTAGKRRSQE